MFKSILNLKLHENTKVLVNRKVWAAVLIWGRGSWSNKG